MNLGMLWFDNNPKTDLTTKIADAVTYYQKKYGRRPNLCFVHPSLLSKGQPSGGSIEVRPNRQILPNHLWIGWNEKTTSPESR
jgi:hypothetical protein